MYRLIYAHYTERGHPSVGGWPYCKNEKGMLKFNFEKQAAAFVFLSNILSF